MVVAGQLRILFRVSGVVFAMPVSRLLAVLEAKESLVPDESDALPGCQLGILDYCEMQVPVYNPAGLFLLPSDADAVSGRLLIYSGADSPWAIRVDQVDRVVDVSTLESRRAPSSLFVSGAVSCEHLALYGDDLLVNLDDQTLGRACMEA